MNPVKNKSVAARPAIRHTVGGATGGGLLGNLPVGRKLTLMVLPLLVLAILFPVLLLQRQQKDINFTAKEKQGASYISQLAKLQQALIEHRYFSAQQQLGVAGTAERRNQAVAEVERNLAALTALGGQFDTGKAIKHIAEDWQELKTELPRLNIDQISEKHTDLIREDLIPMVWQVANNSDLVLEPKSDVHWLAQLAIGPLLDHPEVLDQIRVLGLSFNQTITPQQKARLANLMAQSDQIEEAHDRAQGFAGAASPVAKAALEVQETDNDQALQQLDKLVKSQILSAQTLQVDLRQFQELIGRSVNDHLGMAQRALELVNTSLDNRLSGLRTTQIIIVAVLILTLGLVGLLVFLVVRAITRPLAQLEQASKRLAHGDLNVQAQVASRDELGTLASAFNASVVQLKVKAEADALQREQTQKLQSNIGEFLGVAQEIAQGNLTKRGQVTEDVLGNVVDAVNLTVDEIGYMLKDVQKAAVQVNQGSAQMDQLTGNILEGARSQASAAQIAQGDAQQMSQAIRQMAERAGNSTEAARQTLQAAQSGRQAVTQTLSGMSGIRSEIQDIAENVQTLAQRSTEIEAVTRTLEDFASQTNLLALNASFEAAGAGVAGKRFAIVADEIRKLAEDSAKETQRVTTLVRQVQSDIASVVAKAQEGVREAETGYRVAETAGQRLQEIAQLADQSSTLAEQISGLAQQQVSTVARLDQVVQMIASTAQNTEQESSRGREAAETMRKLALQLTTNLDRFQLPS